MPDATVPMSVSGTRLVVVVKVLFALLGFSAWC